MSKTIIIKQNDTHHIIHVDRFVADAARIRETREFGSTWSHTWLRAGLIAFADSGNGIELTPRGEDLLASAAFLPDDPAPEVKTQLCSKCNGSGEQPLFVSMETCSRCKGSKIEPRASGIDFNALVDAFTDMLKQPRISYSAFIYPSASGDIRLRLVDGDLP
jgi:hypothetical protein